MIAVNGSAASELRSAIAETLTAHGLTTDPEDVVLHRGRWCVLSEGRYFAYTDIMNKLRGDGHAISRH